jgi:hypothetical protein
MRFLRALSSQERATQCGIKRSIHWGVVLPIGIQDAMLGDKVRTVASADARPSILGIEGGPGSNEDGCRSEHAPCAYPRAILRVETTSSS